MATLNRTLSLGQCVFFGVGSILGAGIYALIGKVAGTGGNMTWLAFLIASIAALFTAFSYAELSAAFPKSGGEYVYAKKAFGKKTGLLLGSFISLNGIISGATVSLGFAGYFSGLLGTPLLVGSLGIIALLLLVNISGIRQSAMVNAIFTIIEIGGLIFVIISAIPYFRDVNYLEMPEEGFHGLLSAAALGFYAYIGFEDIVKLAEETKNPEKTIPRALFISSGIVMVVYTLIAISAVSAVSWEELADSESPLAAVVSRSFGNAAVIGISIVALFSTSNTLLSNMLSSSRVLLNMGKETPLLKKFSFISAKRKTPVFALLLIFGLMCAFALIGKIEIVAMIANLFIFLTFICVNLAVLVLRKKEKGLRRPYRIPWNIRNLPITAILGIFLTLVLLGYNVYSLLEKGVNS